jgi:hypothetical protein
VSFVIFRTNCLIKHVIGGKIEGRGRIGRRRQRLLDGLKKKRRYWNVKRKHWIALCEELDFKKAISQTTL